MTDFLLLSIISELCRKQWIERGTNITRFEDVQKTYFELDAAIQDIEVPSVIPETDQNRLRSSLEKIENRGLIRFIEDTITCLVPFDILTGNIIPELSLLKAKKRGDTITKNEVENVFKKFLPRIHDDLLGLCIQNNLFTFSENDLIQSVLDQNDIIFDDLLTYIDNQDALQIKFGIFDTEMTGSDVFSVFEYSNDPFRIKTEYGLRMLLHEGFLLPLSLDDDILKWKFRSRIGEIVRLLHNLRQRFPEQTVREAKNLTRGVKLEVVDRKYPIRSVPIENAVYSMENLIKSGGRFSDIRDLEQITAHFIEALVAGGSHGKGFEFVSEYQDRSFKTIFSHLVSQEKRRKGLILTAGTGMGKTLSYLAPLLYAILLMNPRSGTKAINIYPRIKLAENQIAGFVKTIYQINKREPSRAITIGIDYTGTPYKRIDFKNYPKGKYEKTLHTGNINRYWKFLPERDAYACPYAKCPHPGCEGDLIVSRSENLNVPGPLICSKCGNEIDFIRYTKEEICRNPPDILIITTEMLTKGLSSSSYQHIFGDSSHPPPELVMVDEVHLHTSLKGSQVAMVIRRLLQRLSSGRKNPQIPAYAPIVLGLSATIGKPITFFSELTGIPERYITSESPQEEELEKSGAEYYIFIKPETAENVGGLSNLIQTCMCVLHNMPKNKDLENSSLVKTYKALGFVDSLDTVKRWSHDLRDAEENLQLYQLRNPEKIQRNTRLRDFFNTYLQAPQTPKCHECRTKVNEDCIHFQQGECWWFMRYGEENHTPEPLKVRYKTAGEGNVPDRYELLVTTSAMEVGFDDPEIMCVVQYQSPLNIASFTQRKGRAGRNLRNRPLTVTVLNPYTAKDIFYYRNHHSLIEPSFKKPPLNIDNLGIRSIHGFYAILDLLALKEADRHSQFPFSGNSDDLPILSDVNKQDLRSYLQGVFGRFEDPTEYENIYALFQKFLHCVEERKGKYSSPVDLLPDDLPANLFSSINLPSVDICEYYPYHVDESGNYLEERTVSASRIWQCSYNTDSGEKYTDMLLAMGCPVPVYQRQCCRKCKPKILERKLDINQAFHVTGIGNVNLRWGRGAFWVPPVCINSDNTALSHVHIEDTYLLFPKHRESDWHTIRIPAGEIPNSLRPFIPDIQEKSSFMVIRPDAIRVQKFLAPFQEVSHWIYCRDCDRVYSSDDQGFWDLHKKDSGHHFEIVDKRSRSYPHSFYHINFKKDCCNMDFLQNNSEFPNSYFSRGKVYGIFGDVLNSAFFANADTHEYIRATKTIVAGTCNIRTKNSSITKTFGFVKEHDEVTQQVSLGFTMKTDGMNIVFSDDFFDSILPEVLSSLDPAIMNNLLAKLFRFEVFLSQKIPGGVNSFSLDAFLNIYLYYCSKNQFDSQKIQKVVEQGESSDVVISFQKALDRSFVYNNRIKKEVIELFSQKEFMQRICIIHADILEQNNPERILDRIKDIFVHSFKHSLKSSSVILGGFESERDLGGWTNLGYDSQKPREIYIFEQGMYGTGAFRDIYRKYRENPSIFWNFIEHYTGFCSNAKEEGMLKEILAFDEDELQRIAAQMEQIRTSPTFHEKQHSVDRLKGEIRRISGLECGRDEIRTLMRIFTQPLIIRDSAIENWRLYRELNIDLYSALKRHYGRDPTSRELQEACFQAITGTEETPLLTWQNLIILINERKEAEFTAVIEKVAYHLEHVPHLKDYLDRIDRAHLLGLTQGSQEDIFTHIAEILGVPVDCDKKTAKKIRKIMKTLFIDQIEEESALLYYLINKDQEIPADLKRKIQDFLSRTLFTEEIEKRTLTTCLDGCPACLETRCDIDTDPKRGTLLLSRSLLSSVIEHLRLCYSSDMDSLTKEEMFEEVLASLKRNFQGYISYSPHRARDVSWVLSRLLAYSFESDGNTYGIMIKSGEVQIKDLKDGGIMYIVGLQCREVVM